jgi:uncharacterized repeat protein (TIGR03803 family)
MTLAETDKYDKPNAGTAARQKKEFMMNRHVQGEVRALGVAVRATMYLAPAILVMLMLFGIQAAHSQTYTEIYRFTGVPDGSAPLAGLTIDPAGNLYGTTALGGGSGLCNGDGCGTIFRLARRNSRWIVKQLYSFAGGSDGAFPTARVILGSHRRLYGTTIQGGASGCDDNCGTVFTLSPPWSRLDAWKETQLHQFTGGPDGYFPGRGDLVFSPVDGSLFGTTSGGGLYNQGTVYRMQYTNGKWIESVIYSFNGTEGGNPYSGVTFDEAGNLYGTTAEENPFGFGTVFELSPSESGWKEQTLYTFQNGSDGSYPLGGLIIDRSGNLYGTTTAGGEASSGGGTIFELTPNSDGSWTFQVLYSLPGNFGGGPESNLIMDADGNLYGTTQDDGSHSWGSVFKLTRQTSGQWSYSSMHDFAGGSDGYFPYGSVILDGDGNLYGTAAQGGGTGCSDDGCGVVFEITP